MHIELRQLPFLEQEPPTYYSELRVARVMTREPLVLRCVERVDRIWAFLKNTEHNSFPVVSYQTDNEELPKSLSRPHSTKNHSSTRRVLRGIILRKHLSVLLSDRYKDRVLKPPDTFMEVGDVVQR